jgi:hypothetical protein
MNERWITIPNSIIEIYEGYYKRNTPYLAEGATYQILRVLTKEESETVYETTRLLLFAVRCWESGEPYHGHNDKCSDCNKIAELLANRKDSR